MRPGFNPINLGDLFDLDSELDKTALIAISGDGSHREFAYRAIDRAAAALAAKLSDKFRRGARIAHARPDGRGPGRATPGQDEAWATVSLWWHRGIIAHPRAERLRIPIGPPTANPLPGAGMPSPPRASDCAGP